MRLALLITVGLALGATTVLILHSPSVAGSPITEETEPVRILIGPDGEPVDMACDEVAHRQFDYANAEFEGRTLDAIVDSAGTRFGIEDRGENLPPSVVQRDTQGLVTEIHFLFYATNDTYEVSSMISCPPGIS